VSGKPLERMEHVKPLAVHNRSIDAQLVSETTVTWTGTVADLDNELRQLSKVKSYNFNCCPISCTKLAVCRLKDNSFALENPIAIEGE
jgi:hypothetical protein